MPTSQRKKAEANLLPLDKLGAGDTILIHDLLPSPLNSTAFASLLDEIDWRVMLHRGGEVPRRVAVQGLQASQHDCEFPIYRHPADTPPDLSQRPFTPTVNAIRAFAESAVGHPLNHVLIQHYRSGNDYISEHSDKTLDVVRGSKIVNVSLGAERVMTLRLKKDRTVDATATTTPGDGNERPPPRPTQRIPLPHNSMFVMGLQTNQAFLHGIHHDNRPPSTKSPAELAFNGERISLTFRHIGTFLVPLPLPGSVVGDGAKEQRGYLIYGQGATSKTRETAKQVPPPPSTIAVAPIGEAEGGTKQPTHAGDLTTRAQVQAEVEAVIKAFGEENFNNQFDWDRWYGRGFDVIHFT